MSHRKFKHPRHGFLGFLPRKRSASHRGKVEAFPKDDPSKPCKLNAFLGYNTWMTCIVRKVEKPGSKHHKRRHVKLLPSLEHLQCWSLVLSHMGGHLIVFVAWTVWALHLSEDIKRRFYKNWYKSKKKAFLKYSKKYETGEGKKDIQAQWRNWRTMLVSSVCWRTHR